MSWMEKWRESKKNDAPVRRVLSERSLHEKSEARKDGGEQQSSSQSYCAFSECNDPERGEESGEGWGER